MTRNTPLHVLSFALAASVALHVGAIGMLDSFLGAARSALVGLDEPPPMLSITLVQATPPVPSAKASESAAITPPRATRRRASVVRPPADAASALPPFPSEIAVPLREPTMPQTPISESGPSLTTPDSVAPDMPPARETRSSFVNTEAIAPPRGLASAPVAHLGNPSPSYPESARRDGYEGLTVVEVLVSKSGTPVDVKVATTSGVAALDGAAVAGVRQWRFTPATRDREAIDARVRIPIRFRLSEDGR